tara:strand:+ start:83 stop:463 length:381 start_codon:yes stop_codon:yes gene_type:complete
MTIKVLVLKSGEDVLADVQEMMSSNDEVMGYFLTKPVVVKLQTTGTPTQEELAPTSQKGSELSVTMFPWMPIARERSIPLSTDWVVTMVTPIEKIQAMYEKDVLNNGKETDSTDSSDEPVKTGLTD